MKKLLFFAALIAFSLSSFSQGGNGNDFYIMGVKNNGLKGRVMVDSVSLKVSDSTLKRRLDTLIAHQRDSVNIKSMPSISVSATVSPSATDSSIKRNLDTIMYTLTDQLFERNGNVGVNGHLAGIGNELNNISNIANFDSIKQRSILNNLDTIKAGVKLRTVDSANLANAAAFVYDWNTTGTSRRGGYIFGMAEATPFSRTDGRMSPFSFDLRGNLRVINSGAGQVSVYSPSRSADIGNYVSNSIDTFGNMRVHDSISWGELSSIAGATTVIADNSYLYDASNNDYLHHISDTTRLNYNKLVNIEVNSNYLANNAQLPLIRDTIGKIYSKIPSGLTVSSTRLLVDGSGVTQPVSLTGHDSTSDSRKGVVLLANPTITNTTFAATQSGTWTVSNDSTGMSRKNVQVTNTVSTTLSGHDSTSDSRKGVVLLANPTITNDSTGMSRKNVQVTNTVTTKMNTEDSTAIDLISVNTGDIKNSLQTIVDYEVNYFIDSMPHHHQQIKDSLSLIRSQLRSELVTINNNTNTALGYQLGIRDTIGKIYNRIPANLTVSSTRLLVDGSGVTQPVSLSGHDSTTDSRKGVVLLANPTITNDSSTVGRKGVVLLTTPSVQGTAANDAALSGNPVNIGAKGVTAEPTAITADRQVQLIADVVGKLITSPYANSDLYISGSTNAITDTTSTSVIAAAGSGVRNYITSILVTNSHATVSTFVKILDGTTTLWQGYALAAGGGFSVTFPVPLRGTANTAINAKCVTTGANVVVNCAGYKGR